MKIGIVGLGLIGGSLAKALKAGTGHIVYGEDIDSSVLEAAKNEGVIDDVMDDKINQCDLVFIALYPSAALEYILSHADKFNKNSIVIDCCGVKEPVCKYAHESALKHGFTYIGGHPMAGREVSGFSASLENMFRGASMILTPLPPVHEDKLKTVEKLCLEIGFGNITISTPEEHDRIIACTSQLAHIVSSAYVKSPTALKFCGFSAGSFKDMTRVAALNDRMWTELFLDNADNLVFEIESLVNHINEFKDAIKDRNSERLRKLLKDGSRIKAAVDEGCGL